MLPAGSNFLVNSLAYCAVVPTFDHSAPLPAVVEAIGAAGLPCIIVDDGSQPTEAEIIRCFVAACPGAELARLAPNQGKGAAVMAGMRRARDRGFSHVLQVDADGQHDLSAIPAILEKSRAHPAAVISGYAEYDASVPRLRYWARYLTHVWVWIETLSLQIKDAMCGFRIYPLAAVFELPLQRIGKRMDFDMEILVRLYWQGTCIEMHPIQVCYPSNGRSHFRYFHDNVRISWMHVRLFFGMLMRAPRLLGRRGDKCGPG